MRLARPLLPLLLLAVLTAPASAADTTVATTARPTALATGFGVVLYSAYDTKADDYRLMALEDGKATVVPVAPSARPFQADIGPSEARRCAIVQRNPAPDFVSIAAP